MNNILTFYLCGNLYGLEITAVKEISQHIEYTPVPDAPSQIVGLFNMRGQVVTILSLAGSMGYNAEDAASYTSCIILKCKNQETDYTGFLIEKPGSVIEVKDTDYDTPPANLGIEESKFIHKVAKLDEGLLRIIDADLILGQSTQMDGG